MKLVKRVEAAQATIDEFLEKPFVWGSYDCAHLVAHLLKALGHEDPIVAYGSYSTELGALRALKKRGHETLEGALDDLGFERIAPALALPADIVAMPADGDAAWVALGVAIGEGRVIAFTPDGKCTWGSLRAASTAWRVA